EDAERLAQRRPRHAEALDELRLAPERIALRELAGHDQLAELVGDPLRLLTEPRALRPFPGGASGWSPRGRLPARPRRCSRASVAHARPPIVTSAGRSAGGPAASGRCASRRPREHTPRGSARSR